MATTKTNNVKANENVNVTNESAANNVNENKVNNESKATTAPTSEQIAAAKILKKHETEINRDYKIDVPKEVEKTKFAGAYVIGVYRVDESKKTKKSGDKTFYKVYYGGTIYDGYTSTEFCDEIGIERKHRAGSTPKVTTMLDKLQALKAAIEAVNSTESDFVNFAKIVTAKIESEKLESDRSAFVAKYGELLKSLKYIPTAAAAAEYGEEFVKMALKLGYKFADTKEDTKQDTNK